MVGKVSSTIPSLAWHVLIIPLLYRFWVEKLPSKEIQMRSVDSLSLEEKKKRGRKKIAMVNRGRSPLHFSDVDIKN